MDGRFSEIYKRWICVIYAVLGALAAISWQAATVQYNYGGNWTALFCTGVSQSVPPELAESTYRFQTPGYDGQFYRYMAYDPWFEKDWWKYHDAPRTRYWRILVPALAWLLAMGQPQFVDAAYILVILLSVFAGIYWLGKYAQSRGRPPWLGLGFLLIPATLVSIDRMTVDVTLLALCAGFAYYLRIGAGRRLYGVLVLAGLTRETGLLLVASYCLLELAKRDWRRAALYSTAALPSLIWRQIVMLSIPGPGVMAGELFPKWMFYAPLAGIVRRLFEPLPYMGDPLEFYIQALDAAAIFSVLLALGLVAWWVLQRRPWTGEQWAALMFVCLTLSVSDQGFWVDVSGYSRPISPLFFFLGLRAFGGGMFWTAAILPAILMDLRIGLVLGSQLLSVLRGIFF